MFDALLHLLRAPRLYRLFTKRIEKMLENIRREVQEAREAHEAATSAILLKVEKINELTTRNVQLVAELTAALEQGRDYAAIQAELDTLAQQLSDSTDALVASIPKQTETPVEPETPAEPAPETPVDPEAEPPVADPDPTDTDEDAHPDAAAEEEIPDAGEDPGLPDDGGETSDEPTPAKPTTPVVDDPTAVHASPQNPTWQP